MELIDIRELYRNREEYIGREITIPQPPAQPTSRVSSSSESMLSMV